MSLKSGNKVSKSNLAETIFVVSTYGETLVGLWNDKAVADNIYKDKEKKCLQLVTNSLSAHGIDNIEELYGISLELVHGLNHPCTVILYNPCTSSNEIPYSSSILSIP